MGENTQEKKLIEKKESFFSKVKNYFKSLFNKKANKNNDIEKNSVNEKSNNFKKNIKIEEDEENEEMKILELQKRYRRGEIAGNELTEEQVEALSELYNKQIEALRKVIDEKEKQIAESQRQEKKNA